MGVSHIKQGALGLIPWAKEPGMRLGFVLFPSG